MADIIIIAVLAIAVFLIVRKSIGKLRAGQCPGGCAGCSGCAGCAVSRSGHKEIKTSHLEKAQ